MEASLHEAGYRVIFGTLIDFLQRGYGAESVPEISFARYNVLKYALEALSFGRNCFNKMQTVKAPFFFQSLHFFRHA